MSAHALIPTAGGKDFAEPIAAQLRIELAIDHHRSAAFIEPVRSVSRSPTSRTVIPSRAHRRGDGRKVIVAEESPMSRQADVLEQMHLRAIRRIVENDHERWNFITHESLELTEAHHEPAIPRVQMVRRSGRAIAAPKAVPKPKPTAMKSLEKTKPAASGAER